MTLNLSRWDLEMWCICARRRCCVQISASLRQIWKFEKGLASFHCTPKFNSRLVTLGSFQNMPDLLAIPWWTEMLHFNSLWIEILHWNCYCLSRGPQVGSNETKPHCCNWIDYLSLQGLHPRSLYHLLSPISARYETGCCDRKKGHIGGSESKNMNSITYNP